MGGSSAQLQDDSGGSYLPPAFSFTFVGEDDDMIAAKPKSLNLAADMVANANHRSVGKVATDLAADEAVGE